MKTGLLLLLAVAASTACAQRVPGPDPASVSAMAPPVEYRSALESYQAYADEPIAPWRGSNEAVGGGHR